MSRASRVSSGGRVSRLASSCPKDFEFEFFVYQSEVNYNVWWSAKRMLLWVRGLSDNTVWNCLICCLTLVGLLQVAADIDIYDTRCIVIDIIYNLIYAGHALFMFFERVRQAMYENTDFTNCMKYGFVADVLSYVHYIVLVLPDNARRPLKIACYYIRLHIPFEYLWALTSSNLKGSVLGTAFKYFYIFLVSRISCALSWISFRRFYGYMQTVLHASVTTTITQYVTNNTIGSEAPVTDQSPALREIWSTAAPSTAAFENATVTSTARILGDMATNSPFLETTVANSTLASSMATVDALSRVRVANAFARAIHSDRTVRSDTTTGEFIKAMYLTNMMFMPIGPNMVSTYDSSRMMSLVIMVIGSLLVSGAAVASLALVISLYMKPGEVFRARFRLIMDEMASTKVSAEMREKVETFYRMFWLKQKAVSVTQLLPTFPPTLPSAIYTDIYFEAQQRSQILRDLSYQFLWELAKNMVTIHYIPGDAIIKRKAEKASVIYIAYGDIEMLTAEDDDTPILRMTRGTMISPCGGCAPMACGKALVEIRAATYCTAHVLTAANLWRVALKHGKTNGQAFIIFSSFEEHFERVKRHYRGRVSPNVKFKSSILQFKQNLMALKEAKDDSGNLLMTRSDYFLEIAGTYIMRNKADATLTDEADEICLRPTFPCILQPNSSLLIFWHVLMAINILVVIFVHPYYIVFNEFIPMGFKFFDIVVTGFFILDIIVHLSTGANVEEGVAITFAQTCSQQIQSYWFLLDLLATLPIFEFVGEGKGAGLNKLLRMPKVFRVLKTLEDMSGYHSYVLRFFSYTLFMIIATYLFASIHQTYMCLNFHRCFVSNFTHVPYWKHHERVKSNILRVGFGLYNSVSMLSCTGYLIGIWRVFDWHNTLYITVAIEVSTIIMILMEAMYSATIMVTSSFREDYISSINDVKIFLLRNNVDSMLQKRFITYLSLCWHTDKAYSMTHKKSIFFDLPPHVYQDIVAKQRIKYLLCVPFMKFLRPEDLKEVSAKTRLFYTSPNEILQNTGDIGNEIFIIKQGICQLYDPDTKAPIRRITVKDSFGILECLLRFPAFYTVSAVTHVQMLAVPSKYLLNALRVPRLTDAIEYAKEQAEFASSQMRREPFLNYEQPPPTKSLYRFPLLRKFEPDTAFMQPFTRLGFFSILRYVFPRFTIRPDGKYIYRYEWFRALCALASSIIFPSYTYMVLQAPQLYYIKFILDILAYFDILQRMLVGYYSEEGILVSHPSSTAAHYIKGAFLVDLFGCLPFEKLEPDMYHTTQQTIHRVNSINQMLMLNRIVQLYRLPGAMDIFSTFIEREDILLMLKAVPIFLVTINILTCATVFSSVKIYTDTTTKSWIIKPTADSGGSWLHLYHETYHFNATESPWNLQLTVISWIVDEITSTGYDLFQPTNIYLVWLLYVGILLSAMMTMYFAVRVISIRANVNKMLAGFQEHMKDIAQYMEKEKLKPKLQKDVMEYYEYNWEKTGGTDYRNVLKLCDQITLRTDAILHLYGHTFARCPILYNCDLSLLRVVGRAVHSQYFLDETTIISKGDLISDMYFVDYGTVDVRESKEILRTEARLPRGSVFGNLEQMAAIRSPTDIVATAHCHLLQMNTLMFYDIILDFPNVKVLLTQYRPKRENYIIGGLGQGSSLMSQWKEHRTPNSPTIVVSRKGVSNYLNINSRACQTYLIIVSLAVVYLDIYNAGFQTNDIVMIIFFYFFDFAFLLKIPLTYIQPYVVVKGEQRIALAENRKTYFKSEFYYDLVSCLPLEVFSLAAKSDQQWRVFSLLRLNRLLRVMTIRRCLKRHQSKLNINLVLSNIVEVSIWFSLFIHTTSCLWYTVGVYEDEKKPKSSWMYDDDEKLLCDNNYICSLYMVLSTFVHKGVGDIVARNRKEVIFTSILEIVSTLMFMVYVGEFSNIIQYQSFRSFGYYSKFMELQDFLSNNRVSKNLVELVSRYTLHLWRESRGMQIPYFLETAPPCFKLKIMSAAYMQHLIMHPSFKDCEPAFLRQLVGCLTLFRYNTDLFVVKEGEITDSMYLVHNGRVVEIDEDMDDETNDFTPGTHFGQMQGLIRDTPFNYSYKTTSKAEVLTLSLDKWEHLLEYFPISRYSIFKHYPNHPYSRHPSDDSKKHKDKPKVDEKRHMMARRKTEHELNPVPAPLAPRNLSPSESKTYKPFYTPPTTLSTGNTPTQDAPAPKVPEAKPADVMTVFAEPTVKMPSTKAPTTNKPTDKEPSIKQSSAKDSAAKVTATKTPVTKVPAAIATAVAGGIVVTGAAGTGAAALTASSAPKGFSASESTPTALLSGGITAPLSASITDKAIPAATSGLPASKAALIEEPDKISDLKIKEVRETLSSTLIPETGLAKATSSAGRMIPRPTEVIEKLQMEPDEEGQKKGNFAVLPDTKKPISSTIQIYGGKDTHLRDDRHSVPSYITTKLETNLPSDDKEDLLPGRGKTRTEIFDTLQEPPLLPDANKMASKIFNQSDGNNTKKLTEINDKANGSETHLSEQVSDSPYIAELLSPSTSESKSVATPALKEDEIDELENAFIPEITAERVVDKVSETVVPQHISPVQLKTTAETVWPSVSRPEQRASKEKVVQEVASPEKNVTSPPKTPSRRSHMSSESVLKNEASLPYFDYDWEENNDQKEEKPVSEEYEETPKSLLRRMTQHAKKFIGTPSVSPVKDGDQTDASALEQDIKATSALLEKYEERSKKSKAQGAEEKEKSLLAQYIGKRDAELAATQKEEAKVEESDKFIRVAPRRSIVIFGNDGVPPVRTIPVKKQDDDSEEANISQAQRRSVVVFDNEGKSLMGVISPEETNYENDELNTKENNDTTAQLISEPRSLPDNHISHTLIENDQNKKGQVSAVSIKEKNSEHTELPGDFKYNDNNAKSFAEPTDDAKDSTNVADDNSNSTQMTSAPQSSTAPSSSSLKKRLLKTPMLASFFRKKKQDAENPDDKVQTISATATVLDIREENEDYESKLADDVDDDRYTEKRMSHLRIVDEDDELPLIDDDFEEGLSTPLSPQLNLIDNARQTKNMKEDEKKLNHDG